MRLEWALWAGIALIVVGEARTTREIVEALENPSIVASGTVKDPGTTDQVDRCHTQAWVRNLSKHQRKYACWAHTLGETPEEFTPGRAQRGYTGSDPMAPCLTKRGRQLCRALCGRSLLDLTLTPRLKYQHPWIASCVRTHLVNRCGPEGIHCWTSEARKVVEDETRKPGNAGERISTRTMFLPRCNFSGHSELDEVEGIAPKRGDIFPNNIPNDPFRTPFASSSVFEDTLKADETRARRLDYVRRKGYPSSANVRGEDDSLVKLYGTLGLPTNIKKWRQWADMLGMYGAVQETGVEVLRNPKVTRLQLRFVKEILRPRSQDDLDFVWARYGYNLGMSHIKGDLTFTDTDWSFADLLAKSHNLYEGTPKGTKPFEIWGYSRQPLVYPEEEGAETFLKAVVEQPEDYLKMGVCFDTPKAIRRLKGNQEWLKGLIQGHTSSRAETNLALLLELPKTAVRTLAGVGEPTILNTTTLRTVPSPPTRREENSTTMVPTLSPATPQEERRATIGTGVQELHQPNRSLSRVNRSAQDPVRDVVKGNTPFSENLGNRVENWVEAEEETTLSAVLRKKTPFTGLAGNLLHAWNQNQGGDNVWGLFKQEVSQSQVTVTEGVSTRVTWNPIGELSLFTQTVDLEITAPFSPAIDAMDDLTYHLDAQHAMKTEKVVENRRAGSGNPWYWGTLQSLRSHPDFGKVTTNLKEELETFRLHEQASMDHAIAMNGRVALHCQQRTRALLHQQTFRSALSRDKETAMDRFKRSATAIAAAIAGVTGFAFGAIVNRPHVGAEVDGLHHAVYNLHERTTAMMRAEALMNTKVRMLDQGVAAVRRATLSTAGALAVCETGETLRRVMRDLREGRVPIDIFENRDEIKEVLKDVQVELLEPHDLDLVVKASPEQLLKWPARGYILMAPRAENKTEDGTEIDISDKGGLGFGWTHDTVERDQLTPTEAKVFDPLKAERAQLDVMDNAFRAHAKHKPHLEGFRKDYGNQVWELKIETQIPTKPKGSDSLTTMYRVAEALLEVDHRVMTFSLSETVIVHKNERKVGTLTPEGMARCKGFDTGRWVCPKSVVDYAPSCGTKLWTGKFHKLCLKYLTLWPKDKPHFLVQPGSLKYTAYIPPGQTLEVRCGTEDIWSRRDETGVVTIHTQPLCRYRVMGETITILPPLKRTVKSPQVGVQTEFSKILSSAAFLNNTDWGSLTRLAEEQMNKSWTLLDAYENIRSKQSLWYKTLSFVQETATLLTIGILVVLAILIVGLCIRTGIRMAKTYKRKQDEKLSRLREETLEKERAIHQKLLEEIMPHMRDQIEQRLGAQEEHTPKGGPLSGTREAASNEPQAPPAEEPIVEVEPTTPNSNRSRSRSASTSSRRPSNRGNRSGSFRDSRVLEPLAVPAPSLDPWPILPVMGPTSQFR